jgi:hypothetical protein
MNYPGIVYAVIVGGEPQVFFERKTYAEAEARDWRKCGHATRIVEYEAAHARRVETPRARTNAARNK